MEKQEKRNGTPEILLKQLAGKRLVLGGCSGKLRDIFVQNLISVIEQSGADIVLHNGAEKAQAGDYVLLFGETIMPTQRKSADIEGKSSETAYDYADLLGLGKDLQKLIKTKPEAVLFLSDCAVYGKRFGGLYARKEDDLGYVSHTSAGERSVQNLRMAEHLVCRAAREEGIKAKAARICMEPDWADEEAQMPVLPALEVLLYGACGEIYNLPANVNAGEHSPLSPMEIVPDTGKFENLTGMKKE